MYIKQLEIDGFKSFANKVEIPLLKGFTTVSGPNGSGKSNIIDSIMFALSLRTGSALRIENLSDFITIFNNKKEAIVKVIFGDVENGQELSVSRRIRKTNQGYASTYYLNDKIDTLTNIRAILEKYNITPNSYNVMMQGDVTSIIMSTAKARRGIIDEIAGVADFDRRIEQATNELKTVEDRVNAAALILQEVEITLEQLKEEREVALKYNKLKEEKKSLDAQVSTVRFFDLKRNLDLAHENILQANKTLKEEEHNKKDLDEKIKIIQEKYKELENKLKEQGEDERIKLIDKQSQLTADINSKNQAINYAQKQIQTGKQSIENANNAIDKFYKKIEEETLNITTANEKKEAKENLLKEKKEELRKKLADVAGLNSTVDKYISDRNELSKQLDIYKDSDTNLLKESLTKENELKALTFQRKQAQDFVEKETDNKNSFDGTKQLKELEINNLKNDLEDLKRIQADTLQRLDDIKTEIDDNEHDIRIAYRKYTEIEAQKASASGSAMTIPLNTIKNANLKGVHAPIMELGEVDEEYTTALDIAFGGRLANIVVEDSNSAYQAMEILRSAQAGKATFLPLNKMKKAPKSLPLPKGKGIIDFAINLVDFDNLYLDIFYYAVGDTLIVEDTEAAEQFIGKYRMVTLDGTLYEKSSAITGGYIKKSALGFGKSGDKELIKAKNKVDTLQTQHNNLIKTKDELETKIDDIRNSYSSLSTELTKAKIELNTLTNNHSQNQSQLADKQQYLIDTKPTLDKLNKELDSIEVKRVNLSDKIQDTQNRLSEIDNLLNAKGLKDLKEKTQTLEDDIRRVAEEISSINDEIKSYNNNINFNKQLIDSKKDDIKATEKNNTEYNNDIERYQQNIKDFNEQLTVIQEQLAIIDDKIGELVRQKNEINNNIIDLRTKSNSKEADINRINEQIESFKTRRKELEPQLEKAREILEDGGINTSKLEPVEMTIDELTSKIQKLEKKMSELGDVNMRAITSYEEKSKRKEELDIQISTLKTERESILNKMSGFEIQKKEAFLTTFAQIDTNFQDIYHQLSEGEGKLILENPSDPLTAGMTIEARPRDKATTNKLSALSGGEKALTALALVLAIQKYLPAPFYALDEVDASLDTMNVERIADMIKRQSANTQFIVVSHRRPMIESANRTLGVTQKEKGKTKVTGVSINE